MRKRSGVAALSVLVVLAAVGLAAQAPPDLTGKWVGSTLVPNVGEDKLVLDLTKDGDSYAGTIADSAGMIVQAAIANVSFADGLLTFDIVVSSGSETFPVRISLKAEGDTLTGSWATGQGDGGSVTLTREKQ